ncbi:hypothetical protein SAMN05216325_101268 [Nitrosomonas marina]|uniref:Uncharacterized protein n=1 Tax=Nitrosomonas marina TaxID=917 RepID=A0A1H8ASV7_9PROT|nr:hypothetical protein SAMN05216325_101268 [Nitrosomonas marina]
MQFTRAVICLLAVRIINESRYLSVRQFNWPMQPMPPEYLLIRTVYALLTAISNSLNAPLSILPISEASALFYDRPTHKTETANKMCLPGIICASRTITIRTG